MIRRISVRVMLLLGSALLVNAATIPQGAHVRVRLGSEISSATARAGQTWNGTVARNVVVLGRTVAKRGDEVTGKITDTKSSGRLRAPGQLALRLTSINGQPVSSSAYYRQAKSPTKTNAKTGRSASATEEIRALSGGGKGAELGTLASGGTGSQEQVLPAGTLMIFTITK